jgi:hypothetical protein
MVHLLLRLDTEMATEPMPFVCERIGDAGFGWLITIKEK